MKKKLDDVQIDDFLKRNQPRAPEIDSEKVLARSMSKLGLKEPIPRRRPVSWMAFSQVALAAGLVAIFIVSRPALAPNPNLATPVELLEAQWDDEIYDEEFPAMDVGEDFIDMATFEVAGK